MPHRPFRRSLTLVSLLAVGDYLLWNWSLSGRHDVLALVSGLTIPPLMIALAWLLVVGFARLMSHMAQHSRSGAHSPGGLGRTSGYTPSAAPSAGGRDTSSSSKLAA